MKWWNENFFSRFIGRIYYEIIETYGIRKEILMFNLVDLFKQRILEMLSFDGDSVSLTQIYFGIDY